MSRTILDRPLVCPIAWSKLPPDAQRILSGDSDALSINLWFYDDGTPVFKPSIMGEHLGSLLLQKCSIYDVLRCATEFTESISEYNRELPVSCECGHYLAAHNDGGGCDYSLHCDCIGFRASE